MRTEKEVKTAVNDMRTFLNTEVCRTLWSEEGRNTTLLRIETLRWVLEEGEA